MAHIVFKTGKIGLFVLVSLWLVLHSLSCTQEKWHPGQYYFPVNDLLDEGIVYAYYSLNTHALEPEFWYYRSLQTDSVTSFLGQLYTIQLDVSQLVRETITPQGAFLADLTLYVNDSLGYASAIEAEISENAVFYFEAKDTARSPSYQIHYVQKTDSVKITLTKKRTFRRKTTFVFEDQVYPAIEYKTEEVLETETEGFTTSEWPGREIYARGLGLVYFEKRITPAFILEYALKERFPLEQLEEKAAAAMRLQ